MNFFQTIKADPTNFDHGRAIIVLLDSYASDLVGGGNGLSDFAKNNLTHELAKRSGTHVFLAFAHQGEPAGLLISFEGFPIFQCKPLLNIHDLIVSKKHRGKRLSKLLLIKAEEAAPRLGCCKLTLEVLEGNSIAQNVYRKCGFHGYELDPTMGKALFWEKMLPES